MLFFEILKCLKKVAKVSTNMKSKYGSFKIPSEIVIMQEHTFVSNELFTLTAFKVQLHYILLQEVSTEFLL